MNSIETADILLEDGDYAHASESRSTNSQKEILVDDKTTSRNEEESTSVFQVSAKQIICICAFMMITPTLISTSVFFALTKSTYLGGEGSGNLLESSENMTARPTMLRESWKRLLPVMMKYRFSLRFCWSNFELLPLSHKLIFLNICLLLSGMKRSFQ